MRRGIKILEETVGVGAEIQRHRFYQMSLRMWLNKGEPIVWQTAFGLLDRKQLSDDGLQLTADYRIDRESLISGLFYGIEGMRIGGRRLLKISPHMAYRDKGVDGMIPPNAVLKVEVLIVGERTMN